MEKCNFIYGLFKCLLVLLLALSNDILKYYIFYAVMNKNGRLSTGRIWKLFILSCLTFYCYCKGIASNNNIIVGQICFVLYVHIHVYIYIYIYVHVQITFSYTKYVYIYMYLISFIWWENEPKDINNM